MTAANKLNKVLDRKLYQMRSQPYPRNEVQPDELRPLVQVVNSNTGCGLFAVLLLALAIFGGCNVKLNTDPFPKGNPDDPKSDAFKVMYELAKKQGDNRFGSECKHEVTNHGRCVNCLRKVQS